MKDDQAKAAKAHWDNMDKVDRKRLRNKNAALAFAVIGFIVLIYIVSVIRIGGS